MTDLTRAASRGSEPTPKRRLGAIIIVVAVVLGVGAIAAILFAVFAPQGAPVDPNPGPSAESTANPGNSAARGECDSAALAVNLGTATAGAGSTSVPIVFSNVSDESCVLEGFPTVSFVSDTSGTQIGASSTTPAEGAAEPVEVLPGGSVTSTLVALAVPLEGCTAVQAEGIRVDLPESDEYFVIATTDHSACENADVELLSVTAISAG